MKWHIINVVGPIILKLYVQTPPGMFPPFINLSLLISANVDCCHTVAPSSLGHFELSLQKQRAYGNVMPLTTVSRKFM